MKSQDTSNKKTDLTDGSDVSDKMKFTPEVCREMYDLLYVTVDDPVFDEARGEF